MCLVKFVIAITLLFVLINQEIFNKNKKKSVVNSKLVLQCSTDGWTGKQK